jgi:hypothetical protein
MTLDDIATELINLSIEDRKKLIVMIVDSLTETPTIKQHSILELEGLGAEIWAGVDAQKYIDEMRDEWDQHP